jgi:hypothetical protein
MRSRRCLGPGRPAGETKMSGRRVTRKAPLADVERGQAGPRRRPQPFSRILTAWKGYSGKVACRISHKPGLRCREDSTRVHPQRRLVVYILCCWIRMQGTV